MSEKQFCENCGQKLGKSLIGQTEGVEFKEGWFCNGCARAEVERKRKGGNKK